MRYLASFLIGVTLGVYIERESLMDCLIVGVCS